MPGRAPHQHAYRACAVILATATAASLTACSTGAGGSSGNKLTVVASTSVWGSVAQAVGGDAVQVNSIISDPSGDPHSYESSPRDAAAISKANLVVYNGAGYDRFVDKVLSSNGKSMPVIRAADNEHGEPPQPDAAHAHDTHELNEHVWYDYTAVRAVADKVADELSRIQPQNAQKFHQSAQKFNAQVSGLESHVATIAAANQGKKVIVTEPVAHYLVDAAKLEDITPESFVNAVEQENDPPAAAVAAIQSAVDTKQASVVINNPQTSSPATTEIRQHATRNQTPVVDMSETLPTGSTYVQWMDNQINALDNALKQKP